MKNVKKVLLSAVAVVGGASQAMADVAYDSATSSFTGSINLDPYYSGVTIAIAVLGTTIAVGLAIRALKNNR